MTSMRKTSFINNHNITKRQTTMTGEDLYPQSPFYEENLWMKADILPDLDGSGMGWVQDSLGYSHRVRVGCEHFAPHHQAQDCRFGCGKAASEAEEYNSEMLNQ